MVSSIILLSSLAQRGNQTEYFKKSDKEATTAHPSSVYLAGSMMDWKSREMGVLKDESYFISVIGKYNYVMEFSSSAGKSPDWINWIKLSCLNFITWGKMTCLNFNAFNNALTNKDQLDPALNCTHKLS